MDKLVDSVCIPVECLEPEPAEPDELPGLSRPGDCVKSIPATKHNSESFLPNSLFIQMAYLDLLVRPAADDNKRLLYVLAADSARGI